ncbi:serine aminopeptidase S33 family [Georgenia soli]|uniref:Serine aminopeptidase S33 family n=1 Tax=Georgenia soli TaxID=638953 RepID=A0A2A9ERR7_9MICO|nr:alpha/beta fold hydrolase [Georgenia soli]PFG40960.1 serine aminopeptidase S33 family [Georgenia soli]
MVAAQTDEAGRSARVQGLRRHDLGRPPGRRAELAVVTVAVGVLVVGFGLGIGVPRLGSFTLTAFVAFAVAGLGLALLAGATARLFRLTRGWWRVLVVPGTVVAALLGVYVLAVPVAAAVPPHNALGVEAPPAGAEHVSFPTADGELLAGWYVPSRNGAAVVLLHGSGATRASVVDHADVLAAEGYGVLAFDARGHGESTGRGMRWGWFGDTDVAAAVAYLEARPDVDAGRIAAVGLSMGGEEALGAARAGLRAVVAEGVTGRSADDLGWLTAYGWRGRVQLLLDRAQTAVADLLSTADRPTPLREAVAGTPSRPVLLIVAGDVPDETLAARELSAGLRHVSVWTVDGGDHTGGLRTDPDRWTREVIGFLDAATRD